MPLYALGLNHQTAPLPVREQVVFQLDTLASALRELVARPKVREAAILSTCNRTEVYFNGHDAAPVVQWLEEFHRVLNQGSHRTSTRCRRRRRCRTRSAWRAGSILWCSASP